MNPPRVVFDTNILVSALMSPLGNPSKIYKMFLTGAITLAYSDEIISEYKEVLSRPRLRIPVDDSNKILDAIQQNGERIEPVLSTFHMVDEDDRVYYDTAKSASAYLITGNTKHYPVEPFIFTPTEFLEL